MIGALDWSTRAIHLCILPYEHGPPTFRTEPIRQGSPVWRMFNAGLATRTIFHGTDITSLAIEEPAGKAQIHLRPVYGAICSAAGHYTQEMTTYKASEWRRILGLPMGKEPAHRELRNAHPRWCDGRDGDELDSLGLALAWRLEQWRHAA